MKSVASNTGKYQGLGMTSDRTRARMVEALRSRGVKNEAVLMAMGAVPRHVFVDEALQERAYEVNNALPIGQGQTISTPEIVAIMTELLFENGPRNKVLEIGTGCGYQTAVLSRLTKEVFTVERIAALMDGARRVLRNLRVINVIFKHADGHFGYADAAPYDGILMTAAATHVPEELKTQLAVGGRMVLPVGRDANNQQLMVIDRTGTGFTQRAVHDVRFVPLLGGVV
ncbi:MAG: protein-L-isoaspartate(D-aspartate) O-methyltransferase [Betaproteobacteria bacterium]|nr:protein-L-isoaspartate(D-aspartate) O-methyltransferase [Betaproteobacteria bacterium]